MASITTWTRLEPRARGTDLLPSLEGRVYDPAWLLGRQWQVGEFTGEDAGSPAVVQLDLTTSPITAFQAGGSPVPVGGTPIECLAGPEPAQPRTAAESAQAGAELLVQLRAAGMSAAGQTSVLGAGLGCATAGPVSSVGASFLGLISGRLPDVTALEAGLVQAAGSGSAPAALGLTAADATAYVTAARGWLAWRDARQLPPAAVDAFQPDRLEHAFQLGVNATAPAGSTAAATSVGLRATGWAGDELDWYDVDHDPASPVPQVAGIGPQAASTVTGPLSGLSYPGMPAARWWQFEDAHVAFAQVTADPTDLARLLVVEFACAYSNDWYLRPIELPVGSLTTISNFTVRTTFGDLITVPPTGGVDWCVFRNSTLYTAAGHLDGLLLWPALADPVVSEPVELVQFARDEQANLAWALELTVTGQDDAPLDRHPAAASSADGGGVLTPGPRPASPAGALHYQLASDVPDYWFPMPPDGSGHYDLRLLQRADAAGNPRLITPAGRLLAAGAGFTVWQEEVPREGSQVVRERKLARDLAGRLLAWTARRASAGRGPTSSALRYDQATAPDAGS